MDHELHVENEISYTEKFPEETARSCATCILITSQARRLIAMKPRIKLSLAPLLLIMVIKKVFFLEQQSLCSR